MTNWLIKTSYFILILTTINGCSGYKNYINEQDKYNLVPTATSLIAVNSTFKPRTILTTNESQNFINNIKPNYEYISNKLSNKLNKELALLDSITHIDNRKNQNSKINKFNPSINTDILLNVHSNFINKYNNGGLSCINQIDYKGTLNIYKSNIDKVLASMPINIEYNNSKCAPILFLIDVLVEKITTKVIDNVNNYFFIADYISNHFNYKNIHLFKVNIALNNNYKRNDVVDVIHRMYEKSKIIEKKVANGIVTNLLNNDSIYIMVNKSEQANVMLGDYIRKN